MARPSLDIGTYGKIRCTEESPGGWMAMARFRDLDGVTRPVRRYDKTKAAAERKLKKALAERAHRSGPELTRESRFEDCARLWLHEVDRRNRGTTWDRQRSKLNRILPAMGRLRLYECTTHRLDIFLEDLGRRLKPSTVRGYRAALSGVFKYAVRNGALQVNPVREVTPIVGRPKEARALTREERADLLAKADADPRAVEGDLPDVFRYLMGTGVRIGELMGLRWFRVDLERGEVVHGDNLVSEVKRCQTCAYVRSDHDNGQCPGGLTAWNDPGVNAGLVLHQPKTPAGLRTLKLPEFTLMMLRLRYPGPGHEMEPVFGNAFNGWRNPSNTGRSIRLFREKAGYDWFSAHTWRRTAITICDEQGITARETSGYVGHSNIAQTQGYMDRRAQSGAIPAALDAAARPQRGG